MESEVAHSLGKIPGLAVFTNSPRKVCVEPKVVVHSSKQPKVALFTSTTKLNLVHFCEVVAMLLEHAE